jgi:hypothetical protein
MKLALISRRTGTTLRNSLKLSAEESEWDDLQAAIAHIKSGPKLPVDGDAAGRVAQILVERGYRGELTKDTRTTKEWTLRRAVGVGKLDL